MKIKFNEQEFDVLDTVIAEAIEKKTVVEIKDETVTIFKTDEYNTRLENIKKDEYKKGRKEGVEIEWKETKRKLGIELEGKNGDEILDAFRLKVLADAKIELLKIETEKTDLSNQFSQKEKEVKINSMIFTSIPDKALSETLTRSDVSALFKANGFGVDIDNDKEVVKFNGEIIKHLTTLEPLKLSDVMNKFVTDKGLMKGEGGRGAGDNIPAGTAGTLEAFEKEMTDKNIKVGSIEFSKEMGERIKNKTLKI
jgi:hypothetical protein